MRLLLDENVSTSVANALRAAGHDVQRVSESMRGASDAEVMRSAIDGDRVIVTYDLDFGNVSRMPVAQHAGVILLRFRNPSPTDAAASLPDILSGLAKTEMAGRIAIVQEFGVRLFPPMY